MKKSSALSIIALSLPVSLVLSGCEGTVKVNTDTTGAQATYTAEQSVTSDDQDSLSFVQTSGQTQMQAVIRGQGQLRDVSETRTFNNDEVVGQDIEGSSILRLENAPYDRVRVVKDIHVDQFANGQQVVLNENETYNARFELGSWSDFLAGENVRIRIDDDEVEDMARDDFTLLKDMIVQTNEPMFFELRPGYRIDHVNIKNLRVDGDGILFGNNHELSYISPRVRAQLEAKIKKIR